MCKLVACETEADSGVDQTFASRIPPPGGASSRYIDATQPFFDSVQVP
jgi:hypothetical protein